MATIQKSCKNVTVKPISETLWECRVDSVKAVRFQVASVYNALVEVSEDSNDLKSRTEASALAKQLRSFPLLVYLVIWHDLSAGINLVSNTMQTKDMQYDLAVQCICKTVDLQGS